MNKEDDSVFLGERGLHIWPQVPAIILILQQVIIEDHLGLGRAGGGLFAGRCYLLREEGGGALGRLRRWTHRGLVFRRHFLQARGRILLSPTARDSL